MVRVRGLVSSKPVLPDFKLGQRDYHVVCKVDVDVNSAVKYYIYIIQYVSHTHLNCLELGFKLRQCT